MRNRVAAAAGAPAAARNSEEAPETPTPPELAFPMLSWGCSLPAGTEHTAALLPLRNTPLDNAGLATATAPRPNSA